MNSLIFFMIMLSCIYSYIPVIGIYTQDYDGNKSYIAASYVKYLEMSGARVVPLFYSSTQSQIKQTLSHINGVLIPGGDQNISIGNRITQNAQIILQYAIQQYNNGNIFPIWGTCAGQGFLGYLTSKFNPNTRQPIQDARGIMNTLIIKQNKSIILKNVKNQIIKKTGQQPGILYFFQRVAIYQDTFDSDQNLNTFWNVIATSYSKAGRQYISAMQAKNYPIFTVQFHPQKNNFEWKIDANRTGEAIQMSQMLSNNFVEIAKQSKNRYENESRLLSSLIQNYDCIVPDSEDYNMFNQVYVFDEKFIE